MSFPLLITTKTDHELGESVLLVTSYLSYHYLNAGFRAILTMGGGPSVSGYGNTPAAGSLPLCPPGNDGGGAPAPAC